MDVSGHCLQCSWRWERGSSVEHRNWHLGYLSQRVGSGDTHPTHWDLLSPHRSLQRGAGAPQRGAAKRRGRAHLPGMRMGRTGRRAGWWLRRVWRLRSTSSQPPTCGRLRCTPWARAGPPPMTHAAPCHRPHQPGTAGCDASAAAVHTSAATAAQGTQGERGFIRE